MNIKICTEIHVVKIQMKCLLNVQEAKNTLAALIVMTSKGPLSLSKFSLTKFLMKL
jgi:hypothetical protein